MPLYGYLCCFLDAVLTLKPRWSTFFTGESVTFICDAPEGEETDWEYRIDLNYGHFFSYRHSKRFALQPLVPGYSGKYQCFAHRRATYEVKSSNIVSLTVSGRPSHQCCFYCIMRQFTMIISLLFVYLSFVHGTDNKICVVF